MGILDILNNPAMREVIGQLGSQTAGGRGTGAQSGGGLGNILGELTRQMSGGRAQANSGGGGGFGSLGGLGGGLLGAVLGQMMSGGRAAGGGMGGMGSLGRMGGKGANLAAIATVALNFYQKWAQMKATQGGRMAAAQGLAGFEGADDTSILLLKAMLCAAAADGQIDEVEAGRISAVVQQMYPGKDVSPILNELLQSEMNPVALALQVQSAEQAEDLYRFSCLIVDPDTAAERRYLDTLAQSLGLNAATKAALENEASAANVHLASA